MNLIFLTFCWGDTNAILGGILFSATHGALSALMFFISNVLGLIGFSKCWFDATIGMNLKNHKLAPFDLNIKELYIIYIPIAFLFIFVFFSNFFF